MIKSEPTSLFDILKTKTKVEEVKEVKTKPWQFEAIEAIKKFPDGKKFTGSIFKAFRDNPSKARIALSDSIELGKPHSLYFLKVYNELVKGNINNNTFAQNQRKFAR